MDKETGTYMQSDIFNNKKRNELLPYEKPQWLLINDDSLKRQYTVWIQSYVIQGKAKLQRQWKDQLLPGVKWEVEKGWIAKT